MEVEGTWKYKSTRKYTTQVWTEVQRLMSWYADLLELRCSLRTLGWKKAFFANAKPEKHEFVKKGIEDAILGKKPDVSEFVKKVKVARAQKEKDALDEANEKSIEMKRLRLEGEQRKREEKAQKLKEIKDRMANAETDAKKAKEEKTKEEANLAVTKTASLKAKPKKASAKSKAVAKASSKTDPPESKAPEELAEKPEADQFVDQQQHESVAPEREEGSAANDKTEAVPEAATFPEEASGAMKEDAAAGQPMGEDAATGQSATRNDSVEAETVRPTETAIVEAAGALNSQNGNTEVDTAAKKVDQMATLIRQVSPTTDGSTNLKDLMYMFGFACCKSSNIAPDSFGDSPTIAVEDKSLDS